MRIQSILAALAVVVAAAGCTIAPIQNVSQAPVVAPQGKALSKEQVRAAIVRAGVGLGWQVADEGPKKTIKIYLKYGANNSPVITTIERVSRPGCRVYVGRTEIPRVLGGLGINIMTTPRGVMTGRDAHKEQVGGEILCRVW